MKMSQLRNRECARQKAEAGELKRRAADGDQSALTELYRVVSDAISARFRVEAKAARLEALAVPDVVHVFEDSDGEWNAFVNGYHFLVKMPELLVKQDVLAAVRTAVYIKEFHEYPVYWHRPKHGEISRFATLACGTTLFSP